MRANDSAIANNVTALSPSPSAGIAWGFLGVLAFSFTVPMTRVAVQGLPGLFVGMGRAVVAGVLAGVVLAATRQPLPPRRYWASLLVTAAGVVIGFPVLTSVALHSVPASHAAVTIAVLPVATAVVAVVRAHERLPVTFWLTALLGAGAAAVFSVQASGDRSTGATADLLLLGAVVAGAIGYAEGAVLSRSLGSWQTICWALTAAAPVTVAVAWWTVPAHPDQVGLGQWAAFGYLAAVSMFLGFFAWYRGLAIGPIARISQTQLVQPVLTLVWSALLLGEHLSPQLLASATAVVACAAVATRIRLHPPAPAGTRSAPTAVEAPSRHPARVGHATPEDPTPSQDDR
jgi:drug/metabolite transporter (DMT)-like permease